jgi:hypothetical protein
VFDGKFMSIVDDLYSCLLFRHNGGSSFSSGIGEFGIFPFLFDSCNLGESVNFFEVFFGKSSCISEFLDSYFLCINLSLLSCESGFDLIFCGGSFSFVYLLLSLILGSYGNSGDFSGNNRTNFFDEFIVVQEFDSFGGNEFLWDLG